MPKAWHCSLQIFLGPPSPHSGDKELQALAGHKWNWCTAASLPQWTHTRCSKAVQPHQLPADCQDDYKFCGPSETIWQRNPNSPCYLVTGSKFCIFFISLLNSEEQPNKKYIWQNNIFNPVFVACCERCRLQTADPIPDLVCCHQPETWTPFVTSQYFT